MLLGTYEPKSTPWKVEGTPMNFGHELLQPKLDNIEDNSIDVAIDLVGGSFTNQLINKLKQNNIIKEFLHKGGIRCEILSTGKISVGDIIS